MKVGKNRIENSGVCLSEFGSGEQKEDNLSRPQSSSHETTAFSKLKKK
jgi:hypothetical protein